MDFAATGDSALGTLGIYHAQGLSLSTLIQSLGALSLYSTTVFIAFFLARTIYYVWFHPLAKYPGPWWAAATNLSYYYMGTTGKRERWIYALHEKHGGIVRLGPGRLSFTKPEAWKDLYGHRTGGKKSTIKDPWTFNIAKLFNGGFYNIIEEPSDEKHGQTRKIFANAFSDRALRQQEPMLLKYVDMLVARIRSEITAQPAKPIDMLRLYNCTTFDIMAELTFGEPLGMLKNGELTPWVAKVFENVKFVTYVTIIARWEWLGALIAAYGPKAISAGRRGHMAYVEERVERRLAKTTEQPDIWNLVLSKPENAKVLSNRAEINENANLFMLAGTETTATLLSGLTYYLLKNPAKMEKVVAEVRSLDESDLRIDNLRQLSYLQACFEEGLRMYPPVPLGVARLIPDGGMNVAGDYLAEGTRAQVHQFSITHSERNFKNANSFIPERWLHEYDDEFGGDLKEASQPFHLGPRNCLGKNLAYHEMRLIFSKVVYHFDLELMPQSDDWANQDCYNLWEKSPLMIKLTPRKV